jgi:uncharacterized membrane protein YjfL (UPF0719 family)
MKPSCFPDAALALVLLGVFVLAPSAMGATGDWAAKSLGEALGHMALFGLVGVLVAVIGYKLFDKCTPGDLHKEIIENKNTAAAIIGAAVIIGVCLIVAAAMS